MNAATARCTDLKKERAMFTLLMLPLFCVLLPVIVVLGVIGLVFGIGFSILHWLLKGLGGFILLAVILAVLL